MERRSIGQNFRWTLLGSVAFAGSQWLMLSCVAKFGDAGDLGRFAAALALTTPLMLFLAFQLEMAYVSDVTNEFPFRDYLRLRVLSLPLFALIAAGISLARGVDATTLAAILGLVALRAAKMLGDMYLAAPSRAENMTGRGLSLCAKSAISVVFLAGGLVAGISLPWTLLMTAALSLVVVAVYDRTLVGASQRESERVSSRTWELARRVAPMSLGVSLWSVTMAVPAYVVEEMHGLRTLGVFAVVTSMLNVGRTLNMALSTAAAPRFAAYYHERSGRFWGLLFRVLGSIAGVNLAALVFFLLWGRPFLRYAFAPEFEQYHIELLLACGVNLIASVAGSLGQLFGSTRQFGSHFFVNLACLVVSVPVSIVCVDRWGIHGALGALAIVTAVRIGAYAWLLVGERHEFGVRVEPESVELRETEDAVRVAA